MSQLVVLRVVRPYATESEFLQSEDWTITKKSVFLVGAPKHPEGTIVRCELALSGGLQLLVAEGIVARHLAQTSERPEGLVVRFRRMTPASTQFLNRVLSNRESAEGSSPSAAHNPIPPAPVSPTTTAVTSEPQRSTNRTDVNRTQVSGDTAEALKRLLGRTRAPLPETPERAAALLRLRNRA